MEKTDLSLLVKNVSEEGRFTGTATVYGQSDLVSDIFAHGAFADSLAAKSRLPLLWRHQEPIGTVHVSEDGDRLVADGSLVLETQLGRDAFALLKAGAVDGLSVGCLVDEWRYQGEQRVITRATLLEVSLTPVPALPAARVTAVKQMTERKREAEAAALYLLSAQIRLANARIPR